MKSVWIVVVAVTVVAVALTVPVIASLVTRNYPRSIAPIVDEVPPTCPQNFTRLRPQTRLGRGLRGMLEVQVSEEYKNKVVDILKADPDASNLLNQGYNVTGIKPVFTVTVSGSGDVSLKAPRALVVLKSSSGYATVLVDVEQGKVLKIVTINKTVIIKS
ncbi:MAG: hypothetical protein NZ954_07690 [Thermofilaceae archaeon]|nr:hypothetical protein [Thermofilaceae archaeon]MCX8179979.1 hypothetical protein [Thermofilaceae archaeon]MDW8004716.1 hypothetical protein [Thermofilaceae archaeon]